MITAILISTQFSVRIRAGPQARAGPGPPARAGPVCLSEAKFSNNKVSSFLINTNVGEVPCST